MMTNVGKKPRGAAAAMLGLSAIALVALMPAAAQEPQTAQGTLETITVTAEKRAQSELDVPIALTVITGDELTRHQQSHFEDYADTIPGLEVTDTGLMGSQLIIRGLSSGSTQTSPSAAVYIDNTPYTVEGPLAGSWGAAPNLDTYDMQRVEVLKGPQGTLYGADALGGLLKYVTNAPDPSAFDASVQVGSSGVYNGDQAGYDVHAMVNLPLGDDLALRMVGYNTYLPGFIGNDYLHLKDINSTQIYGGRLSLLWQPRSDLTVRFSALAQDRDYSDMSDEFLNGTTGQPYATNACSAPVDCPAGRLVLNNYIRQPGHNINAVGSFDIKWDTGPVAVISTTSFSRFDTKSIWDYSAPLGSTTTEVMNALGYSGTYGVAGLDSRTANAWTQELRLVSAESRQVEWQLGGYFTTEKSLLTLPISPINAATNQEMTGFTLLGTETGPTTYREYAVYGDVDYHVLPTFDVKIGGRYSWIHETGLVDGSGIFDSSATVPLTETAERVGTYSVEATWHFTSNHMLYARTATGFSPGGPNLRNPFATFLPTAYVPEKSIDYEVGFKGTLLEHRLSYQLDGFDILLHSMQVSALIDSYSSIATAGDAHSRGFEWEFAYAPVTGLTLKWAGDYTYAALYAATSEGQSIGAYSGDFLPLVPRWQTSASAQYEQPVFGGWSGFGSASVRYTDARLGDFNSGIYRPTLPTFTMVDFQLGLENTRYSVTLYCKNCANVITPSDDLNWNPASVGTGLQNSAVFTPRTVGIELGAKFK